MARRIEEHKRTEFGRRLVGLPQRTIANYISSSVLPSLADALRRLDRADHRPPAGQRALNTVRPL